MLQAVVKGFQDRKGQISDDLIRQYMDKTRKIDPSVVPRASSASAAAASAAATMVESVEEAAQSLEKSA